MHARVHTCAWGCEGMLLMPARDAAVAAHKRAAMQGDADAHSAFLGVSQPSYIYYMTNWTMWGAEASSGPHPNPIHASPKGIASEPLLEGF